VGDNGPGVPEALRQEVFLPFFTTKAKGTGVGLSLARQVVLAHGGSIALAESESGGALFSILL
jgi:nitrogen-specific signal transduction histidine kinase